MVARTSMKSRDAPPVLYSSALSALRALSDMLGSERVLRKAWWGQGQRQTARVRGSGCQGVRGSGCPGVRG